MNEPETFPIEIGTHVQWNGEQRKHPALWRELGYGPFIVKGFDGEPFVDGNREAVLTTEEDRNTIIGKCNTRFLKSVWDKGPVYKYVDERPPQCLRAFNSHHVSLKDDSVCIHLPPRHCLSLQQHAELKRCAELRLSVALMGVDTLDALDKFALQVLDGSW